MQLFPFVIGDQTETELLGLYSSIGRGWRAVLRGDSSLRLEAGFGEDFADGGERVFATFGDVGSELIERSFAARGIKNAFDQPRFQQFKQVIAPMLGMFFAAFSAGFEMDPEFSDGFGERVDSLVFVSDNANYWRLPAVARHHQRHHGAQLLFHAAPAL